ncbi:MAG: hypothetical protein H8D96_14420 [Desulfobacterales bacterium]|uniref:Uncharacterized protein n=1 Tax=Candidatus Desulfatibia vada TaxID=2841696 RepID=A0A8J6TN11_9BACT|nr:hypothetical protein [Candidatus Desulfatibia vada]MBL6970627.1 hypothetical protein [Desulfobacterales bacterium]
MSWPFKQKSQDNTSPYHPKGKTLPNPKPLPAPVVRYITVILGHNPQWASRLKSVEIPRQDEQNIFNLRIFDQGIARENGVSVTNFHTLDSHPELVIYEGWIDKLSSTVVLNQ